MSSPIRPAPGVLPMGSLHDVAHPAAAPATPAQSFPPVAAPVAPVIPIRDVTHVPAAVAETEKYGPVTESEPLPVPLPAGITRSQLTAEPQQVTQRPSMIAGIAPETALYKPEPQKKVAPAAPTAPAPAAVPVTGAEVHDASPIAGGTIAAPLVPLPQGTVTAVVDTPFAVTDSVRKFAESHGIDLGTVTPSGKGGRITKKDIESAIAAAALAEAAAPVPAAEPVATPAAVTPELVGDDEDDDKPLTVMVHMPPREADSTPVAASAPALAAEPAPAPVAVPDPATEPVPVAAPAPVAIPVPAPANETATLRVHLDLSGGHTFQIGSGDDLLALAAEKLPLFRVLAAVLEVSTKGSVLVTTVDSRLEVVL